MTALTRRDVFKLSTGIALVTGCSSASFLGAAPSYAKGESTMSIQSLRILGPDSGKPVLDVAPIISLANVHENIVYVCGLTADPTRLGDIKDQTQQVLDRIDKVLAATGTSKSRLLTAQVWLTDMSLFEQHNTIWNGWVDPKSPPVRMCVQSPQLWHRGLLVEIMVTAAK